MNEAVKLLMGMQGVWEDERNERDELNKWDERSERDKGQKARERDGVGFGKARIWGKHVVGNETCDNSFCFGFFIYICTDYIDSTNK
ncbi:MAG TPA: hypothetical protein PLE90_04240 [Dysgonamonadaceae bacterium]|nr:hypothetical protein [Dysgonamonadaceae bacterium]